MNTLEAEETGLIGFGRSFFWSFGLGSLLIDASQAFHCSKGSGDPYPRGKKVFFLEFKRNSIVSVLPLYTLYSIRTEFQVLFAGPTICEGCPALRSCS